MKNQGVSQCLVSPFCFVSSFCPAIVPLLFFQWHFSPALQSKIALGEGGPSLLKSLAGREED